jgi:2-iminobutanoate/2-iminopropanoate deaminase
MQHINTPNAPRSRAPLSQAVRSGHLIFTAGLVGTRPHDGVLADGPRAQMQQALQNLSAVLQAGGSSRERIVKVTIFLRDAADYAVVNEVYAEFFEPPYPSRSTVVAFAPDRRILVEIEAVAEIDPSHDEISG